MVSLSNYEVKINNLKTRGKGVTNSGYFMGRPSALGNPFILFSERWRDKVCDQYEVWLRKKIKDNDINVMTELEKLETQLFRTGKVELACFCAPKRCHAESVKAVLLERMETYVEEMNKPNKLEGI